MFGSQCALGPAGNDHCRDAGSRRKTTLDVQPTIHLPGGRFPSACLPGDHFVFVTMEKIPDEVFSTGVLGTCCGIDPEEGKVYAPIDGKISQLTDTLHAIGIEAGGIELLIHVGVDTVDMNGDGFANVVNLNQSVKKGDLLLTMDLEKIRAAGHPATVIMAVTNTDDFSSVEEVTSGIVQIGNDIL